jgi:hypothetical protein
MTKTLRCKYCAHVFASTQGHRSHLAQARKCHVRWQADLDTMRILPKNMFETCNDYIQTAEIRECPSTDGDPNMDQNVDKNDFSELPADEPPVLEERREECQHDEDYSESTPPETRWREDFPHQAGHGLRREPTMFEALHSSQVANKESVWGAFSDEGDWEVARWLLNSGTTQAFTNKFLELKKVSEKICCRVHALLKHRRSEKATSRPSTTVDLFSKRSTLFREDRNGFVNSSKCREILSKKVVLPEGRQWNFGDETLLNAFKN